jgi:peptidoglycan/LPS O-acetylase OafA/YrhL
MARVLSLYYRLCRRIRNNQFYLYLFLLLMSKDTTYLETKGHYQILDGLRGVASLFVVAFHIFETYADGDRFKQIINHGYLAVDFFFVLSGFVVAYAYDDRWGKMTQWDFYKRRLIRLQPMVIAGSVIGALFFYAQSWRRVSAYS